MRSMYAASIHLACTKSVTNTVNTQKAMHTIATYIYLSVTVLAIAVKLMYTL